MLKISKFSLSKKAFENDKFVNQDQGNLSIIFSKPYITILGKEESGDADRSHVHKYIRIDYLFASKVNSIVDMILQAQTLSNVTSVLKENNIMFDFKNEIF